MEESQAELFLHPLVPIQIGRDEVTGNDLDDLRTLLTRGEPVAARVMMVGNEWRLSLLDVDDDDEPVPAVALLRGAPLGAAAVRGGGSTSMRTCRPLCLLILSR